MVKKILVLTVLGLSLSGCFMAPMALIGPASSGFTTASLVQSGITSSANYLVKKSTGKSVTEHIFDRITKDVLIQTYLPKDFLKLKKINKKHHNYTHH